MWPNAPEAGNANAGPLDQPLRPPLGEAGQVSVSAQFSDAPLPWRAPWIRRFVVRVGVVPAAFPVSQRRLGGYLIDDNIKHRSKPPIPGLLRQSRKKGDRIARAQPRIEAVM